MDSSKLPDEKLPVLVWIYGGGMMGGTSASSVYNGEGFCKRGVILVTFNYRTGAIGLLAHPELSKEAAMEVQVTITLWTRWRLLSGQRKHI